MTDTTTEAWQRLRAAWAERAELFGRNNAHAAFCRDSEATLRALAAERDAALAREARMRSALAKIAERSSYVEDPELTMQTSWGNYDDVFFDGRRQADYECAAIARAALVEPPA